MAVLTWSIFIEDVTFRYTVPPENSMVAQTAKYHHNWICVAGLQNTVSKHTKTMRSSTNAGN